MDVTRDLWREARQRTKSPTLLDRAKEIVISLPGQPSKPKALQVMEALARTGCAVMVDISSYEKGAKIKNFYNSGMTHLCLRMGYPATYLVDHWDLTEDECYRGWFEEAADCPGLITMGYVIYMARIEQDSRWKTTAMRDFIDHIMGSYYKPQMLWLDDEVDHWSENGKDTYATPVNQVEGIKVLTDQCRKKFQMMVGHYSARWFMNKYRANYETWLDPINKPENLAIDPATFVPSWYAWYVKAGAGPSLKDLANQFPIPTSTQEASYLNIGNNNLWELWQGLGDYISSVGKIDLSVSRRSADDLNKALYLEAGTTPPPVDPPVPPAPGDYLTRAEFAAFKAKFDIHTHATGGPVA